MMSVEEAVAVTECRMALEGLCAAKAAQRATDEQIDALVELGHAMRAAVEAGEPTKYSALNRELDVMIQEIAGQPVAAELLRRLHGQVVRHQFQLAIRPGRSQVSLPEHLAVIDAIARRDADGAEAANRSHLRGVIAALRENENGRR
ncbi:FCD domain-containing protein [Kutzneria sp. NPDC051319]|uniref:GntR family transcriptional regulator n=1 Tax=Kutzneria sp. NPDC051319 TaxID=3155047 RepID=UPI00341B83E8